MTTPARLDPYYLIHKGLRALLSDLVAQVGRPCDCDDLGAERIRAALVRAIDFLQEHAHHEDLHADPVLRAAAPEVAASLAADHARFAGREVALLALADGLVGSPAERRRIGDALHVELIAYVEAQFRHMRREETVACPALWAAYDDDAIAAISAAILRSIPPARYLEWMALQLPAWSLDEAAAALAKVRAAAPPEVADAVFTIARQALGARWHQLPAELAA